MKFMAASSTDRARLSTPRSDPPFRAPGMRIRGAVADFHHRGLVAIRAGERAAEQNSQSNPQPVATAKCPRIPVLRAAFRGEHRGHAERAARAGSDYPLQNADQDRQTSETHCHDYLPWIVPKDGARKHHHD